MQKKNRNKKIHHQQTFSWKNTKFICVQNENTISIVNKSVLQDNNRERQCGVDNGVECVAHK